MEPLAHAPEAWHFGGQLAAPGPLAQARDFVGVGLLERTCIAGKHGVAVGDHRLQRLEIGVELGTVELQARRHLAYGCEAEHFQCAYVHPAYIELIPARRQFGRGTVGVMIVMELFAADQDAPRHDIAARVFAQEIAVAPVVSDAIDDARGGDRYPRHLNRPDGRPDRTEQREVDYQHKAAALPGKRRVDIALYPVVRRAETVFLKRFQILRFVAIQLSPLPEHLLDASGLGAVRVVIRLDLRVMLTVDGNPLLGQHPGREPEPETEKVTDHGVQVEAAVRLGSMQVYRDRRNGHVRQRERDDDIAPPRQRYQAGGEKRRNIKIH